jgi:hypothetical protein
LLKGRLFCLALLTWARDFALLRRPPAKLSHGNKGVRYSARPASKVTAVGLTFELVKFLIQHAAPPLGYIDIKKLIKALFTGLFRFI